MFLRLQALAHSLDGHVEREVIKGAFRTLRVIQTEKLGYPEWHGR